MKQCAYCNAQIPDESKFCGDCGREYPQGNTCPHCGARVYDGDVYCENCGRNLSDGSNAGNSHVNEIIQEDEEESRRNWISYIIGAIALLAICGGGWFGYNKYTAYTAAKQAREKIINDSLESVRQDSLRMVEQKEKEELEAKKLSESRKKITFENVLALLKHPNNAALAEKCGLSVIEGVFSDTKHIVYGYDVKKGEQVTSNEYELKPTSKLACYLIIYMYDKVSADLGFIDKSDADALFNMAKDYGLIECQDNYYIPTNRIANGITVVDELESIDGGVQFMIVEPSENGEWSDIYIWSQE